MDDTPHYIRGKLSITMKKLATLVLVLLMIGISPVISWSGNLEDAQEKVRGLPIAMPPLEEQHRIVAKADELIAQCDQLKASLNDAQAIQNHLADAIVEQAVA